MPPCGHVPLSRAMAPSPPRQWAEPPFCSLAQRSAVHIYLNFTCCVCLPAAGSHPKVQGRKPTPPGPWTSGQAPPRGGTSSSYWCKGGRSHVFCVWQCSWPGDSACSGWHAPPLLQGGSGCGLLGAGHPSVLADVSRLSSSPSGLLATKSPT